MNERYKKCIIGILLSVVLASSVYQLAFLFVIGPQSVFGYVFGSNAGLASIGLDMCLIAAIILSRDYISGFFESRSKLNICLGFILFSIILDLFFEISFQYSTPSFQMLWVDFMFRLSFFVPWILAWVIILYFFKFPLKSTFILGGINGIIGEFFIIELFFPGYGMAAALGWEPFSITMGAIITFGLYGCNLCIPFIPFKNLFEEKFNQKKHPAKYLLAVIPLYAFFIAFQVLKVAAYSGFLFIFY